MKGIPFSKSVLHTGIIASLLPLTELNAEEFKLEEVIVTAQKRAESLQDVPVSVAAVGGDKLREAGIENIQDLSSYVPNLKVVEGGLVPMLFIRGIGSGSNQGFEQSVGVYTDGVYTGRSLQARASFMDIERVEVLRGPQGVLFGQSSIAGAISQTTAKPTSEFEGFVSASYGAEYDEKEINAVISGPLTDNINARLALRDREEGGYVKNQTLDKYGPSLDENIARIVVDYDVNDSLSASFKAEYSNLKRKRRSLSTLDTGAYDDYLAAAALMGGSPLLYNGGVLNQPGKVSIDHNSWVNEEAKLDFENKAYVLTLDYEFENHSLNLISAYSEYKYVEDGFDADHTELPLVKIDMEEKFDQFSQEIRLTSNGDSDINYIGGIFYQNSKQDYREVTDLTPSSMGFDILSSLPVGALDIAVDRPFIQESETLAAFGQVTWDMSYDLRLLMGLRFSRDEKEGQRSQIQTSAITGLPLDPLVSASLSEVAAVNGFQVAEHDLKGSYSKNNWTPAVTLQYDVNENAMLYISYSEGYKAAGFDARGINGFSQGDTGPISGLAYGALALGADNFFYDQEEAKTYELGAKMSLLDGSAEMNVALYWTEFSDMQVSVFDGIFGFAVTNAGEAVVRGFEVDGRWQAGENLLITGNVGYLDYEWQDYSQASCPAVGAPPLNIPSDPSFNCNFKGYEGQNTPEWSANLAATHTLSLTDTTNLVSSIDFNFRDNHYTAGTLDKRSEMPATTFINARLALAASDDTWTAAIVAKNITDRKLYAYSGATPLGEEGFAGEMLPPRRISVEASYRF
ncbi:TonB-dependent receptor [Maricurvus nonylphenolicus]|uniref:TonB-dependent receptor n=1 Tax=Maricurvus nonylphenolicus TaxID=1008307 RepID=UPI0036F412FD